MYNGHTFTNTHLQNCLLYYSNRVGFCECMCCVSKGVVTPHIHGGIAISAT